MIATIEWLIGLKQFNDCNDLMIAMIGWLIGLKQCDDCQDWRVVNISLSKQQKSANCANKIICKIIIVRLREVYG